MLDLHVPLQGEHDHAWELVNALGASAGENSGGAARRRRRMAQELVRHLSGHELSEELIIWPAVRRHCPDGDELAAVGLTQEHDLKLALNELSSISPSQEFDECVDTVAGRLRAHFSYEESQVWPRLTDSVSTAEATALLGRWRTVRPTAATRPHPHLPPRPTLLGPIMPVLATTDRLMDAATGLLSVVGA